MNKQILILTNKLENDKYNWNVFIDKFKSSLQILNSNKLNELMLKLKEIKIKFFNQIF